MTPRLRRLNVDYQLITTALAAHPFIQLVSAEGAPPDRYVVDFNLTGLTPKGESGWEFGQTHRAEIFLPLDYPRRAPVCRMLSPVFHPNIDPQKICIGDHWSAGQTLPLLITRIAEMIAFQSYNVKSPLNARAAAWAEQHPEMLPLDRRDFTCG
jgi:ubiquitin-protein ligase